MIEMPNKDGTGPPSGATGARDGRGKRKGYHAGRGEEGIGKKTGGGAGEC